MMVPRHDILASLARLLMTRAEPQEIAWGMALGIMAGMTPFLGFHLPANRILS